MDIILKITAIKITNEVKNDNGTGEQENARAIISQRTQAIRNVQTMCHH